jgi:hypothetical protein
MHRTAAMLVTLRPTYRIALACNRPTVRHDARTTVERVVTQARTQSTTICRHAIERVLRTRQGIVSLAPSPATQPLVRARRESAQRAAFPRVRSTTLRAHAPQPSASATPAATSVAGVHAERPRSLRVPPSTASPPLAPGELSRVTEHVIRQLDRRVLSYRERTGQV